MHKNIQRYGDIEFIRPFDVVHYDAGRLITEGVVWHTEPIPQISRLYRNNSSSIVLLGPILPIKTEFVFALSQEQLPIQQIEDSMVTQMGGEKFRFAVRNIMLEAVSTTTISLFF